MRRGEPSRASAAIVGGGIGGIAAAVSLLRAGFDVHVYERAGAVSEVGAGIQVSPNASRVLHRLGLADDLARMGVRPLAWHQRRWDDGRTLLRADLGDAVIEAFGFPHYQMHRADLLGTLVGALPPERLHVGHRFTGLVDHGDRVEATFANGTTIEVDLLVGADGIHSAVREVLFGPQDPVFTGCAAYRGLVPAERLRHLDLEVTAQIWMGPDAHFVHYFVQGGRLVNFVAVIEQDSWTRESWTDPGDPAQAIAAFEGWHPQLHEILGDACHPMLPFMAQGAAQALEDGATLTACLAAEADVAAALRRYEQSRVPRAARIQALSTENKTRFHLPDGERQREREARMAGGGTESAIRADAGINAQDAAAAVA